MIRDDGRPTAYAMACGDVDEYVTRDGNVAATVVRQSACTAYFVRPCYSLSRHYGYRETVFPTRAEATAYARKCVKAYRPSIGGAPFLG